MTEPAIGQAIVYQRHRYDGSWTEPKTATAVRRWWSLDAPAVRLDNGETVLLEFDNWKVALPQAFDVS